ncbi:MAG TPA: efflux RND transporter permease subunit, partial [Thermodesulfobacteriota bacterium]
PEALAARGLGALEIARRLEAANVGRPVGELTRENRTIQVRAGPFFESAEEVAGVVVGVADGRPVYLRDVARVIDGPEEPLAYSWVAGGPAAASRGIPEALRGAEPLPAVTLALAKRHGTNAVAVAEELLDQLETLRREVVPDGIEVLVTRNYGETADEKVNELVRHLVIAVATILVLLAFALGWREAVIVSLAVPMTLALTLLANLLAGYSINRVTLFALILSLGLLVDDPIVDVENIHRHLALRREPPLDATLTAVDEVRPPTILATFTVIAAFLPMLFVTGLMGPYMRPMPFNVPVAMLVSLIVAFTVTPWAAYRFLRMPAEHEASGGRPAAEPWLARAYRRAVAPFLASRRLGAAFLAAVALAFAGSLALVPLRVVPLKMLPFDNKDELQVVFDLPEGAALEATARLAGDLTDYLRTRPEVAAAVAYVGVPSPFDFNGLVRHYYLREAPHQGDVRLVLAPKAERREGSHALALRIRPEVERIAREHGATVAIVETPPGPPVLATLVAEVYGPPRASYADIVAAARHVRRLFEATPGVVDVDDYVVAPDRRLIVEVDRAKAAIGGVETRDVVETLALAIGGAQAGTVHVPAERTPLPLVVRLPREARSAPRDLARLSVAGTDGRLVPLGEITRVREVEAAQPIYRKDLERVMFVLGDTAGTSPAEAVLALQRALARDPLPEGFRVTFRGEGEWQITLDVFRDLGLAFAAALVAIYALLAAQTGSFVVPLVIMVAIPLTLVGILPGFALLNAFGTEPVAGYPNPIFFTATAMIGMIALAGIVVRNSIILIDFIDARLAEGGRSITEAVLDAGAVRIRPILLTAGAAMLGAWVIVFDPIFSGLAWSFLFGIFASTLFTVAVVPVIYQRLLARRARRA